MKVSSGPVSNNILLSPSLSSRLSPARGCTPGAAWRDSLFSTSTVIFSKITPSVCLRQYGILTWYPESHIFSQQAYPDTTRCASPIVADNVRMMTSYCKRDYPTERVVITLTKLSHSTSARYTLCLIPACHN